MHVQQSNYLYFNTTEFSTKNVKKCNTM